MVAGGRAGSSNNVSASMTCSAALSCQSPCRGHYGACSVWIGMAGSCGASCACCTFSFVGGVADCSKGVYVGVDMAGGRCCCCGCTCFVAGCTGYSVARCVGMVAGGRAGSSNNVSASMTCSAAVTGRTPHKGCRCTTAIYISMTTYIRACPHSRNRGLIKE